MKPRHAEPAGLRDVDRRDRRYRAVDPCKRLPHADTLEDQPRAVRQRERPIASRLFAGLARVERDDVKALARDRERQRRADRAGADDDDVVHGLLRVA